MVNRLPYEAYELLRIVQRIEFPDAVPITNLDAFVLFFRCFLLLFFNAPN